MYRVKIYKSIFEKHYFWYVRRCFLDMEKEGIIDLTILDGSMFEKHDHAYEVVYINDYPIFIDLRDCFTIDKNLLNTHKDFTLLKSNYSSELWDMAEKDEYPEGFEYKLKEWELKYRKNIKPFVLGRTFTHGVDSEFVFSKNIKNSHFNVKYFIFS